MVVLARGTRVCGFIGEGLHRQEGAVASALEDGSALEDERLGRAVGAGQLQPGGANQ